MIPEPTCWTRRCKHYIGVIQPDDTELSETNSCTAFPEGIPYEIAYGINSHNKPLLHQENDIIFELKT